MVDTRNLTVMFTDIKGFTARTSQVSRQELASFLKRHEDIVLPLAAARGGTLIKTIGDAFLFTFESPTNAVLAGIDVQVALRQHNNGVTALDRIELRIGINAGDVTLIEGDVFGDAVNIASRIESLAEPSSVFFSEAVFLTMNKKELEDALSQHHLRTSEVGYRALKGVNGKVRIYKIQAHTRPSGTATFDMGEIASALSLHEGGAPAPTGSPMPELELQRSSGSLGLEPRHPSDRPVTRPYTKPHKHVPAPRPAERVAQVLAAALAVVGLVLLFVAVVFHSAWFFGLGLFLVVAGQPFYFGFLHSRALLARVLSLVAAAVLLLGLPRMALDDLATRSGHLTDVVRRDGPGAVGFNGMLAAYGLCMLRVLDLRLDGAHDAARSRWALHHGDGAERVFESEEPMSAPSVVSKLAELGRRLETEALRGHRQARLEPTPVRLRRPPDPDAAWFAYDPLQLSAVATRQKGEWSVAVEGRTPTRYVRRLAEPMFSVGGVDLEFEPILGWMLQERGWVKPYTAIWRWQVRDDDPRLRIVAAGRRP